MVPNYERSVQLSKQLTDDELANLRKLLREEAWFRYKTKAEAERQTRIAAQYEEMRPALAHLFLQIAHALACRMALRWMKGHTPVGTNPMHGACWTAQEGAELTHRHYHEQPPIIRYLSNQNSRLAANPLLWNDLQTLRSGLSRPLLTTVTGAKFRYYRY